MPRDPTYRSRGFAPEIDHIPFGLYAHDGWSLEVECWACHRVVYIPPADLVGHFGAHASTGIIGNRLRCGCGAPFPAMRAVIKV